MSKYSWYVSRARDLRARMVEVLERGGSVRTPAIRDAFLAIPRETFVPQIVAARGIEAAYADDALVTHERDGLPTSSSSQPTIMALMLEALDVRPGHRVLEIGLGTGYNAAILKTIVGSSGSVTSIDIAPDVVAEAEIALASAGIRVETIIGRGEHGYEPSSPYDRLIVTASADRIPHAWYQQLKPDGILVVPLRFGAMQLVVVLRPTPTGFVSTQVIPGGFMPMRAGADAPSSSGPNIAIDVNHGDGTSTSWSVTGGGLAALTPDQRGALIGNLLTTPRRIPAPQYRIRAIIWQAVMTLPADRQIVIYDRVAGTRFGIVNASGAAALAYIRPATEEIVFDDIELYGDAEALGTELRGVADAWEEAGRPELDRLRLAVDYTDTAAPPWTVADLYQPDQRWSIGWSLQN